MSEDALVLYHWPQSRSATAHWMLEETGAPYKLRVLNLAKGEHKCAELVALNPLGKLPTLVHNGAVVTETAAICAYLADAFPQNRLAPPIGDPQRGPYLRWLVFAVATLEAGMMDIGLKREPGPSSGLSYGTPELLFDTLARALAPGPWLLGAQFTAADVMIGAALHWGTLFGMIPERAEFKAYTARVTGRPAIQRAMAEDAAIMAQAQA